ncbi:envelope stress response membrane protein PspC [uncultured Psychrosphaera sp.]|jgi:phage shock protein C|uniref:envelope stress response membrane protein PspC n=1 Tax=uncultured Psychrosphaera sp. TaxID=1403522 RepID=UPI00261180B0|nr:envelope stress response membrane protein PspC [uncultured Psychrosphaera sp.]
MTKPEKKQLNRIPEQGKIAGVCAGVAEYINVEVWLVRIIWFSGLILSGGFFFLAYIVGWFILDKKTPNNIYNDKNRNKGHWGRFSNEKDIDQSVEVKTKVWQAGEPARQALKDIVRQFDNIENRVQEMESYVTSNEYTLTREINKL